MNRISVLLTAVVAAAVLAAGCGSAEDPRPAAGDERASDTILATVASYELEAGTAQRFLVGVETDDQQLVGYGTASFVFTYGGTRENPITEPVEQDPVTADYRLIPGQKPSGRRDVPRPVGFDQGAGVYAADDVTFEKPGFWEVRVEVELDGRTVEATAAFEVLQDSTLPEVGDQAPRTVNHLPGAADVPPEGIDSRADDANVPDPELHHTTIADALAAGRPLVVVVSTPVYCVSRFCGPITDSVQALAVRYGDQAAFVHLEVWRDFEGKVVNKAASEWIFPAGGADGAREPWVFTVDRTGTISTRFDNVVSDAELEAAVQELVS